MYNIDWYLTQKLFLFALFRTSKQNEAQTKETEKVKQHPGSKIQESGTQTEDLDELKNYEKLVEKQLL